VLVVTGPTGNVGAEVTRLLVERRRAGEAPTFRIAAHDPQKIRALHGPDVPVVKFDYDDRTTWRAVLEDVSTLFLLFPLPHPRTVETRMKPFINAAYREGCRHVVYLSVPGADAFKVVPHYGVERHIEGTGLAHTFLRSSYFMQNLHRRISTHGVDIAERGEVFIPAGGGRISFIDARDVAAVALDVFRDPAAHRNRAYTLTGPERLDFYEVAGVLSEVLERPIRYASPSFPRFWYRLARRGVHWDTLVFMTIVYWLTRAGRNEPLTDELPALLGRPPTDLRQFAKDNRWRWETKTWT